MFWRKTVLIILLAALSLPAGITLAEETGGPLSGIEFMTGFGWGNLSKRGDHHLVPLIVDLDFDLKPWLSKMGLEPKPLVQFQIEPFISAVFQPNRNVEVGTSFFFKVGFFPQDWKLQPYAKVGAGTIYMTQHTREQATQFNFIEQAGLGVHYFFLKNTAFTVEGHLRHLSNCGIKKPNHGINDYIVTAGICRNF